MPETWTLTSVASSKKELYDLMSALRGSTSHVRPYERRGGVCGVFDLIVDGLTDRERQDMTERMTLLGLRKITEEERRAIEAELLLPGQLPSDASPSPVQQPPTPPPA
jgi:hypothetical protein